MMQKTKPDGTYIEMSSTRQMKTECDKVARISPQTLQSNRSTVIHGCQLLFWEIYNDANCKLKDEPTTLSKEAID